jgi:hypothetical protein
MRPAPGLLLALAVTAGADAVPDPDAVDRAFAEVFAAEAGLWAGECVGRADVETRPSVESARFRIVHEGGAAHRFEGRVGDTAVRGRSRVAGGVRTDVGAEALGEPARARVVAVDLRGPEDYRYVVEGAALRTTVTRLGPRQTSLVESLAADPPRRLRLCVYARTGDDA